MKTKNGKTNKEHQGGNLAGWAADAEYTLVRLTLLALTGLTLYGILLHHFKDVSKGSESGGSATSPAKIPNSQATQGAGDSNNGGTVPGASQIATTNASIRAVRPSAKSATIDLTLINDGQGQ
jgi:hypothetical protein